MKDYSGQQSNSCQCHECEGCRQDQQHAASGIGRKKEIAGIAYFFSTACSINRQFVLFAHEGFLNYQHIISWHG